MPRALQRWRIATLAILCATLCACGGGGGSSPAPAASVQATASPSAVITTTFTLKIPTTTATQRARTIASISSGTQSFVLALTSVNGVPNSTSVTTNLTSPSCTVGEGNTTCSVQIAAPGGLDVFTVTLYAGIGGTGAVLGTASVPQTIAANGINTIAITVNGTIATIQLLITPPVAALGTPRTSTVSLIALDASGAQILVPGNYTNPITLTSADAGGHVKLSVNGGTPATTVQSTTPSDSISVVYDGGGTPQGPMIGATAAGISGTSTRFVVDTQLTLVPAAITFTQLGASGAQTVEIGGGLAPFTVNGTTSSSSPPVTYSVSGALITLTASAAASETFTVADSLGTQATLSVTSSTITVPIQ
jgi:hypothetical protein